MKMKVRFKKLEECASIPTKAHPTDAGFDLVCTSYNVDQENGIVTFHTAIAVALPKGYFALLCPRSSVYKYPLQMANGIGIIDQGYHGELIFKYRIIGKLTKCMAPGEKVGQLVILPLPDMGMEEVHEFEETERGEGGFGSSGR